MHYSPRRFAHSVPFDPQQIPRSLMYGLLDAELPSTITQSDGAVSAWRDLRTGQSFEQATADRQPTYSATSFDGRPGITFDGLNQSLRNASTQMWPLSGDFEVWMLTDCLRHSSGTEIMLEFPSSTSTKRFRIIQNPNDSLGMQVGDGATNAGFGYPASIIGRHVLQFVCTGTRAWVGVDGSYGAGQSLVPALDNSITRNTIGGSAQGTAMQFANFTVSCLYITRHLPDRWSAPLYSYLARRAGL